MTAWDQYKKTFVAMQVLVVSVTVAVFLWSRVPGVAGTFFVTMQCAALVGAAWGARLKNKVQRDTGIALR